MCSGVGCSNGDDGSDFSYGESDAHGDAGVGGVTLVVQQTPVGAGGCRINTSTFSVNQNQAAGTLRLSVA